MNPTADDHALAVRLAVETGEVLVEVQNQGWLSGLRGWALEQEGDRIAHEFIVAALSAERPNDGLLSEEGADDGTRTRKQRAWIVDPLDGSSGFGSGNDEWAVHVALVIDGLPVCGAVAVPGIGLVGSTMKPETLGERSNRVPVVVTGRTRAHQDGATVAGALGADLIACSSAGVKTMLVVDDQADVYVHDGPLYEWDVCAPAAVALAAGLDAVTTRGEQIEFNHQRPVVDSLLICRREFTEQVVTALQ